MSQVLCSSASYEGSLPLHYFTGNFLSQWHFFFCLLYFVTYSHTLHQTYNKSVCQAKKVTKGLWLLAAVLSLPTAYARVNMEVIDRYKKIVILSFSTKGGWESESSLVRLGLGSTLALEKSWTLPTCHYSCTARVRIAQCYVMKSLEQSVTKIHEALLRKVLLPPFANQLRLNKFLFPNTQPVDSFSLTIFFSFPTIICPLLTSRSSPLQSLTNREKAIRLIIT